jgi:N-acetyl-anhydromuramyl-L-alanine amidase AmpD
MVKLVKLVLAKNVLENKKRNIIDTTVKNEITEDKEDKTMDTIKEYLPIDQYSQEVFPKKQIYLHHTAGNSNPHFVVKDWATDQIGKIGTAYVIGGGKDDGVIIEVFDPKHWAWHLGVEAKMFAGFKLPYTVLDKISVGIEICNWGSLTKKADGKYYTYVNTVVPDSEVCVLDKPFRGFQAFHKYSDKQIESTKQLVLFLSKQFNIPVKYNEAIWDLNTDALKSVPGVYTHNCVRHDKTDISPQPNIIAMLKSISV